MSYRIGVDIGGTFTDFALLNDDTGALAIHKQLTTPKDPAASVLEGCEILLKANTVDIAAVTAVVHGTTLVTNAVIERRGAVTGALVTKGFRDIFDIALERRYDLFDLRLRFPDPLVPRHLRIEVDERVRYDGAVEQPLSLDQVRAAVKTLVDEHHVEAIAVCFLHSYTNPENETAAAAMIRREFPKLSVCTSAEVFPHVREYERWTTATMNAYAQPMVARYIESLEHGLASLGFKGQLYIMASNGGTIIPEIARRFPVRILESGPAAGALMSALQGRRLNLPNLLSFDMGGTTAKGCLIRGAEPLKKYTFEVARMHEFKAGSGLPVRIPVIDMIEIGAGGGSIAEVDAREVIRVGPRSAGADPGPVCYGRGGERPALTDADLVLGYLDGDFFLGGKMKLDRKGAETVIGDSVGKSLNIDSLRAAWGIHEIINEDVARAFRVHASERGFDYRGCTMIAFGGAGPVHALRIARKLKIPRVVLPVGAGVMSALGLLASPLSFEVVRSNVVRIDDVTRDKFAGLFEPIVKDATGYLTQAGVKKKDINLILRLDMRYYGQGYELEVTLPQGKAAADMFDTLPKLFAEAYEHVFGMAFLTQPVEIVNWKVEARGPFPKMREAQIKANGAKKRATRKGERSAYFPEAGGYRPCPVYDRYALTPGDEIEGPAFIEENESTCVVGVGDRVAVDQNLNLVAEISH
jgi:N-methylhydantoinase A